MNIETLTDRGQRVAHRRRGAFVFAGLWLGWLGPATETSQAQSDLVESVSVRVVNVDVVVTDRKGRPIPGLQREDFQVFEDGREVEITNFFSYEQSAAAPRQEEDPEPGAAREVPQAREPFTLAIYIDERNTMPDDRERVLMDLERFLRDSRFNNAELVVASYRNRLQIHAGPTRNLSRALSTLRETPLGDSRSLESTVQWRQTLSAIMQNYEACETATFCNPCQDNFFDMMSMARDYATAEHTRTVIGISGLADLVGTLSGLDGRKAVLYIGGGFQQRGGFAAIDYVADLCETERPMAQNEAFAISDEYDATSRIDQLAQYANGNRVTFYMLDAVGVRIGQGMSVDFASRKFAPTQENDRIRIDNVQASHTIIAGETGGRAILNAQRPVEQLELLADELAGASYSLGFVPDHPPSGKTHLLKVELVGKAAKGARIRHRRSYQDKQLEARLVDQLVSTLYLENETNPLAVRLSAGATARIERGLYDLPVRIEVPEASFLQITDADGYDKGRARLWLSAVSDQGERKDMRQRFIPIGFGGAVAEDGVFRFTVNMTLGEGRQTVGVGLRDELTQEQSIVRMEIDVPNLGVGVEAERIHGNKDDGSEGESDGNQ